MNQPFGTEATMVATYEKCALLVKGKKKIPPALLSQLKSFYIVPDVNWDTISSNAAVAAFANVVPIKGNSTPKIAGLNANEVDNASGALISNRCNAASIVNMHIKNIPKIKRMFDKVIDALADEFEVDVKEFVAHMSSRLQTFNDNTRKFGPVHDITDLEYRHFQQFKNGQHRLVGPYLLIKILHQLNVSYIQWNASKAKDVEDAPLSTTDDVAMIYSRNGINLISDDKYTIRVDDDCDPHDKVAFAKFLAKAKHHKKLLLFRNISRNAYDAAEMFMFRYDVKVDNKSKTTNCTPNPSSPDYGECGKILDKLLDNINSAVDKSPGADFTWDKIAAHADVVLSPEDFVALAECRESAAAMAEIDLKNLRTTIAGADDMDGNQKARALKAMGFMTTPTDVMTYLEGTARKLRNRKGVVDVTQYIQKNVGSVYGGDAPQFADTSLKCAGMFKWLDNAGASVVKKDITVYGVAYNHMGAVIIKESTGCNSIKYYDIEKAEGSNAAFTYGDIFNFMPRTSTPENEIVIDDSWPHALRNAVLLEKYQLESKQIDHSKLVRFMTHPVGTAFIKMNLASFSSLAMFNLLFDKKNRNPYQWVSIEKFGKLHNEEVYLVLSRDPCFTIREKGKKDRAARLHPNYFNADLFQACAMVYMANRAIMTYDAMGVRFRPDGGARTFWLNAINLLPRPYEHYSSVLYSKDAPLKGGVDRDLCEITEREFGDMAFVDFDGEFEYEEDEALEAVDTTGVNSVIFAGETGLPYSDQDYKSFKPWELPKSHPSYMSRDECDDAEFTHAQVAEHGNQFAEQ